MACTRALALVCSSPVSGRVLGRASAPVRHAVPCRHLQITAFDLRAGDLIEFGEDGQLWRVTSCNFSRQAQGRAFTQAELRNLKTGLKKDVRMRTDEAIEKATLDTPKKLQVLYFDKTTMALMDPETFEQSELPLAALGDQAVYLQEGMDVRMEYYKGVPATVSIPNKVAIEVVEVTPLAASTAKENRDIPAVLSNGLRAKVPKFTKAGDKVFISTLDGTYLGKAT